MNITGRPDIYEKMVSPSGFLPYFKGGLESWKSWLVFFKVLAGRTDLTADEMELFTLATGLEALPTEPLKECYLCCGRQSGKSTACALLAVGYGLWGGWTEGLQGGVQPQIFIISPTMEQGKIILRYIKAILGMRQFKHVVKKEREDFVELRSGTVITIKAASWRSTRGWGAGLIIMEELAFWRFESESANVDIEIYTALKPSTANIKNSLVAGISTPFIRQGQGCEDPGHRREGRGIHSQVRRCVRHCADDQPRVGDRARGGFSSGRLASPRQPPRPQGLRNEMGIREIGDRDGNFSRHR